MHAFQRERDKFIPNGVVWCDSSCPAKYKIASTEDRGFLVDEIQ